MCWGFIKATYMKMNYKMSMGIKMHVISFFSSAMCCTNNIWFFCVFDEKKQDIDHTYQVRLCDNFSSFLKYLVKSGQTVAQSSSKSGRGRSIGVAPHIGFKVVKYAKNKFI